MNDWGKAPDSCYDNYNRIHRKGCEEGFDIFIRIGVFAMVTTAFITIVVEIVAVIFGFYIGHDIQKQKRNQLLISRQTAPNVESNRGEAPQDV
jgi:hypothetical protein